MKDRTKKRIQKLTNPWREGKWVDRWTNVHFLTGVLAGFTPVFFDISFYLACILFTIGIVLWEVIEWYQNIKEKRENQISDIIVGILGFVIIYPIVSIFQKTVWTSIILFIGLFLYTVILARSGWIAYKTYKPYRKNKN